MFKGRISGMIVEECWASGTTVEERFAVDSSVPKSGLGLMGIWFIEPQPLMEGCIDQIENFICASFVMPTSFWHCPTKDSES